MLHLPIQHVYILTVFSNTSLYNKFRKEKEEAWTNAIQSVLLKPEEYPIKLTMLKHDYTLRHSNTCILSSVCDDVVLPFTYIIDFAEELKKVIPQEKTEEKTQYLKKIAELAYTSLNGIKIDDKYNLQTLCLKYKTLKKDYKKIQKEWQNARLRSCASPTANNDEYYQEQLLQLFIKHKLPPTVPPTATSQDIIKCIEDFISEDRFKLYEEIIKDTTLKTTLFSCTPEQLRTLFKCFNDDEQKKQLVIEFIKNQPPESIQSPSFSLYELTKTLNSITKAELSEELKRLQKSTTIPAVNPKPLPKNNPPTDGIELTFPRYSSLS